MTNEIDLSLKISSLIKKSDYSKSEIARLLNVTRGSVQGWARDGSISKSNLINLCNLLNVSPESMLTDNENNDGDELNLLKKNIKKSIDLMPDSKLEFLKALKIIIDN